MKNQGMQKSENEKLLEFGIRLSNLVSDIEELKKDRARLEDFNVYSGRLYLSIRTKDCNIMTLDIDGTFVDFLSQEIVRIIDKKTAELNELKKHITL
jgi:hypothetical protein